MLIAQHKAANELNALDLRKFDEPAFCDFPFIWPKARTAVALPAKLKAELDDNATAELEFKALRGEIVFQ